MLFNITSAKTISVQQTALHRDGLLSSTGSPGFTLFMWGHIKNRGKQKPCKSRLLSSTKLDENRIELQIMLD